MEHHLEHVSLGVISTEELNFVMYTNSNHDNINVLLNTDTVSYTHLADIPIKKKLQRGQERKRFKSFFLKHSIFSITISSVNFYSVCLRSTMSID